ncbi:acyl-CoA dehydrogenase family protein [Nocardia blacklockiae]|uniref:acyl-CoA dehydrogenase family protein n=1 Tax=Nocardia blacklockiae TaxID=480036 RepID=UPI0018952366|nr:acyl-CoA dehydrogenase family protein [Nocardia blacklockiae]MBF6170126.1 acyl-CoA dehydrogenase family protein [Nocardia blacklockiae]
MRLHFDDDVERFRAEFVAFLDEHLPAAAEAVETARSTAHLPEWARRWRRVQFEHGWLVPGYPPRFGGRDAGVLEQYVHQEELAKRGIYQTFNPQGLGIVAASLISFGTPEQQERWAIPILRGERTGALGMSEPGAGSDLAGLRTRAVLDGDRFVVDGHKIWTSGAHDADVLLAFVRTDPDAAKHRGISALLIPTDTPGVERRPFAALTGTHDVDLNEVFFREVVVPAENLVGELHRGWSVANGSLGHERTLLWLSYADRLGHLLDHFHPATALDADRYATLVLDAYALRLLGSAALSRAARGDTDVAGLSVLKLLGSEAVQSATESALATTASDGLYSNVTTARFSPLNPEPTAPAWFERYARTFAHTIAGDTSEIHRNIIAQRILGLPR